MLDHLPLGCTDSKLGVSGKRWDAKGTGTETMRVILYIQVEIYSILAS